MCDCFHVVLPTWPGAPGSGAPHSRLQPASLGRVGSAGAPGLNRGAQCRTSCTRGRKGRRDGWGLVGGSPVLSVLRWLCRSLLFSRTCACLVLLTPFPIPAAHFVSRISITLCGSLLSDSLAVPVYLSLFHRGPPWDTALPSKAAIEACVLHTGWNRPRVNSHQL